MAFLRLEAPHSCAVTTAFISSHPPRFTSTREPRVAWIPRNHYLIYALTGRRHITGQGFDYDVTPETLRFFCAGVGVEINTREKYEEIVIAFSAQPGDRLGTTENPDDTSIHLPLISEAKGNPFLKQRCREILQLASSSSIAHRMRRNALLQILFSDVLLKDKGHSPVDWKIKRVIQILEEDIKALPRIDWLAQSVKMSRRTLVRNFKTATGKGIREFLISRRIQIAQEMLGSNPLLSTEEIASQLGFYDAYHFGHTFKKITGTSPRRFLKGN